MVDQYVQYALHSEAKLTAHVQEMLGAAEPWLAGLSEFLSPAALIDGVIPVLGAVDMELMGQATFVVGLLNVMSSVVKWTCPQNRPYWWVRESPHLSIDLRQSTQTCETTAGFPSAHSAALTGIVYLLLLRRTTLCPWMRYLAVGLLSIPMWTARVYFGSQFPHHCICGSLVAVAVIDTVHRARSGEPAGAGVIPMQSWRKTIAIAAVAATGLFVIGMYFAMLRAGLDPHWSVRMAFMWCTDPQYLRHEASPIFILCRDLGFMMGVAVSTPLGNRLQQRHKPRKVIPAVVAILAANYYARGQTPKNYGRFAFVGYEFVRNALHSFALLTILPKLCADNKQKKRDHYPIEFYFIRISSSWLLQPWVEEKSTAEP